MQETINQRIFRVRKMCGYTQESMAEALNMKISTYSQAERKGKIKTELLLKIAEVLNVSPNLLLTGKEDNYVTSLNVDSLSPEIIEKLNDYEELKKTLSIIRMTDGILTGLLNISPRKREAIYRLIILSVGNKKIDIVSEIARIEASIIKPKI